MRVTRGCIIFDSIQPLFKKPEIFTVGGFSAVAPDGREYSFDWTESYTSCELLSGGYIRMECDLRAFDDDFVNESNIEVGITVKDLTPEFITTSTLKEIFYACYKSTQETEQNFVYLKPTYFMVRGYESDTDTVEDKVFPEEELARYFSNEAVGWKLAPSNKKEEHNGDT